ncbi:MAG: polyphosphate kinase 1 [Flavobacteriales bacterium]|nr:polyphosphate kinase 1 [Flavobacteriales bacterium]
MSLNKLNREISWLAFNERVLQEAEDVRVPLVERMRFLGIFSNNLDEFFRVRVATVRRLIRLFRKDPKDKLRESPQMIMNQIHEIVLRQQLRFNRIYESIIDELEAENIFIINETELDAEQAVFVRDYFLNKVEPLLVPLMVRKQKKFPHLKEDSIYLFVAFWKSSVPKSKQYSLLEVPRGSLSRFLVLPEKGDKRFIIYLDDVIRMNLSRVYYIFDYDHIESFIIKITRDAELDLDDDVVRGFYDKMRKGIERRKEGEPVRFIYDENMPVEYVSFLLNKLNLIEEENIIPGGRYHNFKDFMKFPNFNRKDLVYPKYPPIKHLDLERSRTILELIAWKDVLLHYPYQSFDYVIDMLREAAINPHIRSISITIYRLAKDSKIINALVNAAKNGKQVTVIIELQARFDEAANLSWAKVLTDEGVRLVLGVSGLKIHSKLILIEGKFKKKPIQYVHVGTGNFHEGTANVYSDISLLTSDPRITKEVARVFEYIEKPYLPHRFDHLMVSPTFTRSKLVEFIDREISNARKGKKAWIKLKLNSLVDDDMVDKLYEAGKAGVQIDLIVRGICSLIPGEPGLSENIRAISIVDKYLEHTRIYMFCNDGENKIYISSADLMTRNMDYRIEVAAPIYNRELRREIRDFMAIQFSDDTKARIFDRQMSNTYVNGGDKKIRSQVAFYEYLASKHKQ